MTVITKFTPRAALALALCGFAGGVLAAANGDGLCSSAEAAQSTCVVLNTNVVEFLGAFASTQCHLSNGQTKSCTAYYYRYTGGASNQVNVAIPARLTKTFKTASDINCSQFLTGGAGDPTTGFGKNQISLGVCRIAQNLATSPVDITIPPGANLVLTVDPSGVSAINPLDWQLKQGSSVTAGGLLGPYESQPQITESAVTLTTPDGASVSYSNLAGNVTITGGNARIVPQGGTKLCVVNEGGDSHVPYTSPSFAANWTCETITYATEQCDIKTDGGDPCRMIGGVCIKY